MRRRALAALIAVLACVAVVPAARSATTTCGWPIKADPDLVNIAWPDEGAQYWAAPFYAAPGSTMTIRGTFPRARYISFHLYEGSMPVDAVTDYQIVPSSGTNPFVAGADRTAGGTYEIHVAYGPRPAAAPSNTLYAPGMNGEPNVAGFILYRIYLPEGDVQGGAPLPEVRYTDATGASALPCPDTGTADNGAVNGAIRDSSLPASWPGPQASAQPSWGLARSGASATSAGPLSVKTGNPFFANFDNVYLSLLVWRDAGNVLAFRAKAPTFADTTGARKMPRGEQVRYWSVCTNDFPTTRYVACRADQDAKVDKDGYFTFVVSDPGHRPANLLATDNWLPAGTYPDIFILYRQMLPDPTFKEAIANAPDAASAPNTMGAYYPQTRMCGVAQFELDRCGLTPGGHVK